MFCRCTRLLDSSDRAQNTFPCLDRVFCVVAFWNIVELGVYIVSAGSAFFQVALANTSVGGCRIKCHLIVDHRRGSIASLVAKWAEKSAQLFLNK